MWEIRSATASEPEQDLLTGKTADGAVPLFEDYK